MDSSSPSCVQYLNEDVASEKQSGCFGVVSLKLILQSIVDSEVSKTGYDSSSVTKAGPDVLYSTKCSSFIYLM